MDAQKTINEVVDSVKSEGLFDEFRKECLEAFENMETYHQLKQRVENHVTSFLSKHRYHDGLQKNTLRTNLRNFVSKSDVLLNSIQQLVDEVLSLKGKSFCMRIDKQVDKHLSKSNPPPAPEEPVASAESQPNVSVDGDTKVGDNVNGNMVEEQKELTANVAVTEFTEMEIEEVEMDISENHECEDQLINNGDILENNIASIGYAERHGSGSNSVNGELKVQEVDIIDQSKDNQVVSPNSNDVKVEIKSENELHIVNVFQPIEIPGESNVGIDIVIKEELLSTAESETELEYDRVSYTEENEENNENLLQSSLNLPPIITEPITDDSNSNDSNYADNVKTQMGEYAMQLDESECRRKSSRVRTLPLKLREVDELKKDDDADSVSSNDIDYKDVEDGNHSKGKRGRPRKRPQSAGNPETVVIKNERRSSLSRTSIDNARRRKRSPSISKQEEEAINFLTKTDEREVRKDDEINSGKQKEWHDGRESRDGTVSSKSRDGTMSSKSRDGTVSSKSRDGTVSTKSRDGTVSTKSRDGTVSTKSRDGTVSTKSRDGTVSTKSRDGTVSTKSRDGTVSSKPTKSSKDDADRHPRSVSQKSELKDDDRKTEKDRKYDPRDVRCRSNKEDVERIPRSKRDCKSESGEGNSSYSSVDDDDKINQSKRSKNVDETSVKDIADSKLHDRRVSTGEGKLSGKEDNRSSHVDKIEPDSDEERSSHLKRDGMSDSGGGESHSGKDDVDRKSRPKREEHTQEERDRNIHRRKRPHSPVAHEAEDSQSKRSRRPIKQRQRYSP